MSLYHKIIDLQKLGKAWQRVRKNHSAPGTDQITWEEFEQNSKEFLKQLHIELEEKRYKPQPVKIIELQQKGKLREVSLYSMRDKVLQQSILEELNKIYNPLFSISTYAYRPRSSALNAIECIHERILLGAEQAYFYGDIRQFFDHISIERLLGMLRCHIQEEDVLELIASQLRAESLLRDENVASKKSGIYQGSILAPILSNIYMMEFDCELEKKSRFYIRYSDDFLILCKNAEQASDLRGYLCEMLQMLGLELHEEKSCFGIIKNGFDFLGYHFNEKGKQVPIKAEQHLQNSLEQLWLEMKSHPIEQKLEKGLELSRGWQQYYRGERRAAGILELTVTIYGMQKGGIEDYTEIKEQRKTVHNLYEEVTFCLSDLWNNRHMNDMRLYEYEDYFEWREKTELKEISQKEIIPELFACYAKLLAEENTDDYMELMQIYSDIGNYETARQITEKIEKIKSAESRVPKQRLGKGISVEQKMEQAIIVKDINRFMNCFVGREDIYSEELEVNGRRRFEMVSQPLSIQEVRAHLAGERTLATYVQRNIYIAKRILRAI